MPFISIIIVLLVLAIAIPFIARLVPMDPTILNMAYAVIGLGILLLILRAFGLWA